MSNKTHLFRNILSLGVVQIANYVLPLISIPIIVRVIGPDNFGVINYYTAFVAYFMLLINYGFEYSGTRFIAIERDNIERRNSHFTKILYAKSLLFVLSAIIFSGAIIFISRSTAETRVAGYTFLMAFSWVLSPNWFFQGMQQLTLVALFNFLSKLVFNVLIVIVIKQKGDYVWQPLILSLTQIVVSAVSLFYAIKKFNVSLVKISFRSVIDMLREDRMIFFSMLSTNLYTDTNIVMLGFFETKEHIGYFTAAWRLMFVFLVLLSLPTSQAMFPYIASSFAKNVDRGIAQIKRVLPVIIYASLALSIFLFFTAELIIRGFYGQNFGPAVIVFRILTIVPVLSFINTVLGLQTMVNLKMDSAYFYIIFSGGLCSILLNLVMIRFYGYRGSAWSWIAAESLIAIVLHLHLRKKGYQLFQAKYFNPITVVAEIKNMVSNFKKRGI
ncbi:flippase [Mucilaginibacter sp. CAU 1740]|uniref:flippase n=1 Tax=Mucilaginibacter sp. CAU 1740 TaxID=3140365 RepID=UPI00325A5439